MRNAYNVIAIFRSGEQRACKKSAGQNLEENLGEKIGGKEIGRKKFGGKQLGKKFFGDNKYWGKIFFEKKIGG